MASRIKERWEFRAADFRAKGMHAMESNAFRLFFEFLRISPSYELARKEAVGTLSTSDIELLPSDFQEVRNIYRLLGDVQRVLFREWWYQKGLEAFGVPGRPARIHKLKVVKSGERDIAEDITGFVKDYFEKTRVEESLPPVMLLAIPLNLPKTQLLQKISQLLDKNLAKTIAKQTPPLIQIAGKRFRQKVLVKGLRLLWYQAMYPKYDQWRVAALVGINPKVSEVLDPHSKKSPDSAEIVDRSLMMRSASRDFLKYKAVAENAARGHFPCFNRGQQVDFDWYAIRLQIASRNAWEKRTKAQPEQSSP